MRTQCLRRSTAAPAGRALPPRGPSSRCGACARVAGVKTGSGRMAARSAQGVLARPTLAGHAPAAKAAEAAEAYERDQHPPHCEPEPRPALVPVGETLFSARSVWLTRCGRAILQSVDIDIAKGEILTLIGPNGAGKTTLVRVLLGLEQPDRGTVRRKPGLVVGYVPQRFAIDRAIPLTV